MSIRIRLEYAWLADHDAALSGLHDIIELGTQCDLIFDAGVYQIDHGLREEANLE